MAHRTENPGPLLIALTASFMLGTACPVVEPSPDAGAESPRPSFFITSAGPGDGANLGGLEGADAHCLQLAEAIGEGARPWRAYLGTFDPLVHPRDRIGEGPWFNVELQLIADDLEALHSEDNTLTKETALSEAGDVVNGRGDSPNVHDILTGAALDGTLHEGEGADACGDWASNDVGSARLGHHDRVGGGDNPTSWASAHDSAGCSQADLRSTGGDGLFYCFAAD